MGATIGSLVVRIGADISSLVANSAKASGSLGSLDKSTKKLGNVLKALGAAAAVTGLGALVKESMDAIDSSAKLSRQLGGTINGLKGLQLAASDAGVDSGALKTSMEALNKKLGEAARTGAGEAFDAFQRLGLSARELGAMDLDQRMATIADAIQETGLSSQGTADALAKMGLRQNEVTRLMLDGGAAIRGARTEIDELGLSLSEIDAAKVEAANDAMARVKLAATAIQQRLAVHLAPVLTAIANQFIDIAKDTNGFRRAVDGAVGFSVKAIGFLGDTVRGVHLVFKTVELAAWGMGTAMVEVFRAGTKAIAFFVDLAIGETNRLIETMNLLPGIDITPLALASDSPMMKALDDFAANMRTTTADVFEQLKALATEEWPSDKAAKFYAEIQAAAEKASVQIASTRREILGDNAGASDGPTEAETKALDKLREQLERQLGLLREYAMSEEELEQNRYATRLEQLNQALNQELLTLAEYATLSESIEKKHMDRLAELRERGMDRVQDVSVSSMLSGLKQLSGLFSRLTADAAKHNKKMFDTHKGFAIADALISGAQGIAQTLGAYPYPYNLLLAIPHAAAAAAQVAAISSQSFSGGGSVTAPSAAAAGGGGARSGGGVPSSAQGGGVSGGVTQLTQVNLQGDNFSRAGIISLIGQINEAQNDGARIVVV